MERSRFIGGAEKARRRARKIKHKKTVPNHHHGHHHRRQQKKSQRLPKKINPPDRFLASLLLTSVDDLVASNDTSRDENWRNAIGEICDRAGVPFPAELQPRSQEMHEFFGMRASLVLEESRCILAETISSNRMKYKPKRSRSHTRIDVKLISAQERKHGFMSLTFGRCSGYGYESYGYGFESGFGNDHLAPFTPSELYHMKPGNVLQVCYCDANDSHGIGTGTTKSKSILTSVVPSSFSDDRTVTLMAYRTSDLEGYITMNDNDSTTAHFNIIPIANLISEQRQFVACYSKPNIPFMFKLMGAKSATHTRFDSSDDGEEEDENDNSCEEKKEEETFMRNDEKSENNDIHMSIDENDNGRHEHDCTRIPLSAIDIPKLNAAQEAAAVSFLHGPLQNLSLVQGPPGTGKTQFMTAILIRTFLKNYTYTSSSPSLKNLECDGYGYCRVLHDKRVLVTAPTNKAITVIASRFLRAVNGFIGLNVILIGVEDSLFPNDGITSTSTGDSGGDSDQDNVMSSLRSIFLYTWVEELMRDFKTLHLSPRAHMSQQTIEETLECAKYLVLKMKKGIPSLCKKLGCVPIANKFISNLQELQKKGIDDGGSIEDSDMGRIVDEANGALSELLSTLSDLQMNEDPASELLSTANIIFSTLSSSGVSLMKRTRRINELFVDEAAAATEPEILIPLHLRPSRMLAVGDPKQLPATITSQRAVKLGLDRSLLDRLMFHCGQEHLMLEIQYRMKPDISYFPNNSFYGGRLENGDNVMCPSYKGEISVLDSKPYSFIQVNGEERRASSGSYYNMHEARAVVQIVEKLRYASSASDNNYNWASLDSLRIITFYSGQVVAIRDLLRQRGLGQVQVATVDSSQGSESDIVIVSFVRCEGRSGFLQDDRRINVALTRARFQLICIGDADGTLMKSEAQTLRGLANDAQSRKLVVLSQNLLPAFGSPI